jgi:hypothetical protein
LAQAKATSGWVEAIFPAKQFTFSPTWSLGDTKCRKASSGLDSRVSLQSPFVTISAKRVWSTFPEGLITFGLLTTTTLDFLNAFPTGGMEYFLKWRQELHPDA